MTAPRIAFVAVVIALCGCTPPTCDPRPLPAGYGDAAALLPAKAVVCAQQEGSKAVFLQFASRDVKSLGLEAMLKLREANWELDKNSRATDDSTYIVAWKNKRNLNLTINRQNGGPYQGRITGNLFIADR